MSHPALLHHSRTVSLPAPADVGRVLGSVWFIGGLAALLRLPFLLTPLSPDEGGFLAVAQQWHPGTSLYGNYWVDRPPGLIALFRASSSLSTLLDLSPVAGLRLVGLLAAFLAVAGVGTTARLLAGRSAARWSALLAAGLFAVPAFGSLDVNGELLAAPFIAWGSAAAVASLTQRRHVPLLLVATGASIAAAVMVKQNMIDPAIFVGVLYLGAGVLGLVRWPEVLRRAAWVGFGLVLTLGCILGGAWLVGTSPSGVYDAMYPFRLAAAPLLASLPSAVRDLRIGNLLLSSLASLVPLVLLALVAAVARSRRLREAAALRAGAIACLAVALYDVVSIALGGSFWIHYLVQLAVPAALAGGLLTRAVPRPGRMITAATTIAGALAYGYAGVSHVDASGPVIGSEIAAVASPSDTVISALGDGDIVETSGLRSPYPYLWSLPAHTLDVGFGLLHDVMSGPDRPTWLVVRGPGTLALLDRAGVSPQLIAHYTSLGTVCGRRVYHLTDGSTLPHLAHPAASDCHERLVF